MLLVLTLSRGHTTLWPRGLASFGDDVLGACVCTKRVCRTGVCAVGATWSAWSLLVLKQLQAQPHCISLRTWRAIPLKFTSHGVHVPDDCFRSLAPATEHPCRRTLAQRAGWLESVTYVTQSMTYNVDGTSNSTPRPFACSCHSFAWSL